MLKGKLKLVDKKLVHKYKDENVLIYNLRRILPRKIPKTTFEQVILPKLTEEEKNLVHKCYVFNQFPINQSENYFILSEIPNIIEFQPKSDGSQFTDEHVSLFEEFYQIDDKTGHYFLDLEKIEEISFDYKFKLLNQLGMRDLYIPDEEKLLLSEIFEKVTEFEKSYTFITNMYVDIDHNFFFEHPNEHVPGIMVIEAARQFFQSIMHKYGNEPFEGMSNILTKLDCQFFYFLELNFPIKMKQIVNKFKTSKEGYWNELDSTIYVYQKNNLAVSFNLEAKMIKTKTFKRIRKDNSKESQLPRFKVLPNFDRNISIRSETKKKYLGRIADISKKGFRIEFDKAFEENISMDELENEQFEFFLYFEKIGFVHGHCILIWQKNLTASFEIVEIDNQDSENLVEALKRCCYVIEERELL